MEKECSIQTEKQKDIQENEESVQEKKEIKKEPLYVMRETVSEKDMVKEASLKYASKRQGEYTLEDYYALPDDQRVELIDGVIYDMAAPNMAHQTAATEITFQLKNYINSHGGKCFAYSAPVDVQLDCDDRTMVQPDVLVICDRDKIIKRCVYGAPDLVIEILSPSSERKDLTIKLAKYIGAGVREYWVIDLRLEKVIVYDIEHNCRTAIYGMDKHVPVQIFGGDCQISFAGIMEMVRSILNSPEPDENE
ncbi:MAG: Uma2 family endonuclease [Lachnospiraceae bacterium]|nr:Uma2 family endonuclease [Lachnospiraceae bacterium]